MPDPTSIICGKNKQGEGQTPPIHSNVDNMNKTQCFWNWVFCLAICETMTLVPVQHGSPDHYRIAVYLVVLLGASLYFAGRWIFSKE